MKPASGVLSMGQCTKGSRRKKAQLLVVPRLKPALQAQQAVWEADGGLARAQHALVAHLARGAGGTEQAQLDLFRAAANLALGLVIASGGQVPVALCSNVSGISSVCTTSPGHSSHLVALNVHVEASDDAQSNSESHVQEADRWA